MRRSSEADALVALLGIMARTPRGSWPGAEHFGVRDLLAEARTHPEKRLETQEELNLAFAELGLGCRIAEIQRTGGSGGREEYTILFEPGPGEEPRLVPVGI